MPVPQRGHQPGPRHPGFPPRPLLRPGVRVTRRGDGRLQVGLAADLAVTAPDTAEVRSLIADLEHGVPPTTPGRLPPVLARFSAGLLDHGLVVDGDDLLAALGRLDRPEDRATVAATHADLGLHAGSVLARRASTPVTVCHDGAPDEARRCAELLAASGCCVVQGTGLAVVLVSRGEPDRDRVDGWLRDDVPHLLVTSVEGRVCIGPFVVPGRTACLRCVDAHEGERDPRRALVVQQYADARDADRGPVPDPVPEDLMTLALIWAARDVAAWADGARPRTWSTTVHIDPRLELPTRRWRPHAGCGCTWQQLFAG